LIVSDCALIEIENKRKTMNAKYFFIEVTPFEISAKAVGNRKLLPGYKM